MGLSVGPESVRYKSRGEVNKLVYLKKKSSQNLLQSKIRFGNRVLCTTKISLICFYFSARLSCLAKMTNRVNVVRKVRDK